MSLGIRGDLADLKRNEFRDQRNEFRDQRFSPFSLELFFLSFCMLDCPMLCNMLVGDLECVVVPLERSPLHLFLYLHFFSRKNKDRNNKGSTS